MSRKSCKALVLAIVTLVSVPFNTGCIQGLMQALGPLVSGLGKVGAASSSTAGAVKSPFSANLASSAQKAAPQQQVEKSSYLPGDETKLWPQNDTFSKTDTTVKTDFNPVVNSGNESTG